MLATPPSSLLTVLFRGRALATHHTPAISPMLQRLHVGLALFFKGFEKLFCKIEKSILANTTQETVAYKVLG